MICRTAVLLHITLAPSFTDCCFIAAPAPADAAAAAAAAASSHHDLPSAADMREVLENTDQRYIRDLFVSAVVKYQKKSDTNQQDHTHIVIASKKEDLRTA